MKRYINWRSPSGCTACADAGSRLAALSALLLVIGLGGALASPRGLSAGESYRIMYLHVPTAMWSMGLYGDGRHGLRRGGLADQNGRRRSPPGAGGAVCTGGAGQRRGMGKPMWGRWIWDARLTSELVLLFLYAGVIALWHAFDDRRLAGARRDPRAGRGGQSAHHSLLGLLVEHPARARPTCSKPSTQACVCRCGSASCLPHAVGHPDLMRLRNLILQLERHRPWVVALVNKGAAR